MDLFKLVGTIAVKNQEANKAIDDTTDKAESGSSSMVNSFKKIGTAIATYFAVDKIIDFGKQVVSAAAEVAAETAAFEQIMGDYSEEAAAKVGKVADATGVVDTRLTPYMTSMTAKFKGLGYGVEDATDLASRGLMMASDASSFWDKSLDESMSHLNSFINGSYEGGEAIGLFANDTQMAMYAVKTGLIDEKKEWANLEESIKQATRLEYAENMMKSSGATGQAAREAEQYANTQGNLNEKWRQFKAQIGEPILQNVVTPAMQKLSDLIDTMSVKFEEAKTWINENKDKIHAWTGVVIGATTAVSTFLLILKWDSIITKAVSILGKLKAAFVTLNATLAANPIGLVVAAIAGLVAAFIYLWNNCEPFKQFWIDLWEKIKVAAKAVADWFVEAWGAIGDFFSELWEGIKSVFSKFINWFKENWDSLLLFIINPVAGVFDYLYDNCEGFRNKVNQIVSAVKEFFKGLWDNIKETASSAWQAVKDVVGAIADWFTEKWTAAKNKFTEIWNAITNFLSTAWETIKNVVQVGIMFIGELLSAAFQIITLPFRFIWENCKEYVFAAWEWIKEKVTTAINAVKDVISTVMNTIKSVFNTVWGAIKNFVTTTWNSIKSAVTTAVNAVKSVITTVWNAIKNFITPIINSIKSAITTAWNAIKSAVTTAVNAVKTAVTNAFNAVKNKVTEIWNNVKTTITNAVNTVKEKVTTAFNAVKSKVTEIFNSVKAKVTSIWNNIKTAITNAVNAIKSKVTSVFNAVKSTVTNIFNNVKTKITSIWNNIKSTFTNTINNIKSTVTSKFNEIKTKIQTPIEKAREKIKSIIDKIKSYFDNLKLKLPKIKLPHFKISGEFSLDPPKVPKFSIEWYKKAMQNPMLMTEPTIFGYNPATGSMMGGGEAGAEVVSGAGSLMRMIRNAVNVEIDGITYYIQKLITMLADFFPELIAAAGHDIITDDGTIIARYTPMIDKRLGEIQKRKERGR